MQYHIALVSRSFTRTRAGRKSKNCRRRGGKRKFLMAVKFLNSSCDNSMILLAEQLKGFCHGGCFITPGQSERTVTHAEWCTEISWVTCVTTLAIGSCTRFVGVVSRTLQTQRLQAVARRSWPSLLQGAQIGKICIDLQPNASRYPKRIWKYITLLWTLAFVTLSKLNFLAKTRILWCCRRMVSIQKLELWPLRSI